ncbi:hypothetical protein CU254_12710 [Amycolatopsis sp. AA4]|uniref:hypothetical protein n=1 Tax=Actinomycetes TaxID=1760 RepID=UPI0001B56563|nr:MULTISPECIES: hypothetical protein [Actinomycetes]ATY11232.1 hypothetical protein CU254_12710 [Amycolatopsis sp. AA4]
MVQCHQGQREFETGDVGVDVGGDLLVVAEQGEQGFAETFAGGGVSLGVRKLECEADEVVDDDGVLVGFFLSGEGGSFLEWVVAEAVEDAVNVRDLPVAFGCFVLVGFLRVVCGGVLDQQGAGRPAAEIAGGFPCRSWHCSSRTSWINHLATVRVSWLSNEQLHLLAWSTP